MDKIEYIFKSLADVLWGDWLLAALLGLGAFYTGMTGGIQFKFLKLLRKGSISLSPKKNAVKDEKNAHPTRRFAQPSQAVWEAGIS